MAFPVLWLLKYTPLEISDLVDKWLPISMPGTRFGELLLRASLGKRSAVKSGLVPA